MSEFDQEDGQKKWLANPDFNPARCNVVAAEYRENLAQPRVRPRVGAGRRRFDILTIGLHWATVTLMAGMFASAWLLGLARADRMRRLPSRCLSKAV